MTRLARGGNWASAKKYASNLCSFSLPLFLCVYDLTAQRNCAWIVSSRAIATITTTSNKKYPTHKKRWKRRKKMKEKENTCITCKCIPPHHYRKTGALYTDYSFQLLSLVVLLSVPDSRLPPRGKRQSEWERERDLVIHAVIFFLLLDGIQVLNLLEVYLSWWLCETRSLCIVYIDSLIAELQL